MKCLVEMLKLRNTTFGIYYAESQNMPDLKFVKSEETENCGEFLFKGQNMPDVIILVFRKRGMYCFRGQKRCALSNFKDRK